VHHVLEEPMQDADKGRMKRAVEDLLICILDMETIYASLLTNAQLMQNAKKVTPGNLWKIFAIFCRNTSKMRNNNLQNE